MEIKDIRVLADKLHTDILESGIEGVRKLFSKGETLSQELRYDTTNEYLKKMIMAQMNIGKMLLTHKYEDMGFEARPEFNKEADQVREQAATSSRLQFDDNTLNSLFGNSLEIKSEEEYEEWQEFVNSDRHNEKTFDSIYFEEEFKFNYEKATNPLKKFIQSFRYRKMLKDGLLEDSYIKKVREMIKEGIKDNPDDPFTAYGKTHRALEKGVLEYEDIKDVEDITRMVLASLTQEQGKPIDIETVCYSFRNEMRNAKTLKRIVTEYRKRQVTLGSETGINKRTIQTIPFAEVPEAIRNLQREYEQAYNTEQSQEEYIKQMAKIYAEFVYIQPYEDGNKRTALCLFNSMLLSKGITPPPISLINDEQMVDAFHKAQYKDYTMLQDVVIQRYKTMEADGKNKEGQKKEENDVDKGLDV